MNVLRFMQTLHHGRCNKVVHILGGGRLCMLRRHWHISTICLYDSDMSSPLLLAALPRLAGSSGLAGSSAGAVWTLAADLAALPLLGLSLTSSCNPTGQFSH